MRMVGLITVIVVIIIRRTGITTEWDRTSRSVVDNTRVMVSMSSATVGGRMRCCLIIAIRTIMIIAIISVVDSRLSISMNRI